MPTLLRFTVYTLRSNTDLHKYWGIKIPCWKCEIVQTRTQLKQANLLFDALCGKYDSYVIYNTYSYIVHYNTAYNDYLIISCFLLWMHSVICIGYIIYNSVFLRIPWWFIISFYICETIICFLSYQFLYLIFNKLSFSLSKIIYFSWESVWGQSKRELP